MKGKDGVAVVVECRTGAKNQRNYVVFGPPITNNSIKIKAYAYDRYGTLTGSLPPSSPDWSDTRPSTPRTGTTKDIKKG